jgi:ribosomal protein S18 acetylase RimI-like enzyme
MPGIVDRPYAGERDLERASDLLLASRVQAGRDREPTTKRLSLLVTSRLWEPSQDAHVWEAALARGASGRDLAGFALLWRREESNPHLSLELVARHSSLVAADRPGDLTREMLDWALKRVAALAAKMSADVTLNVATFDDQQQLQALLRRSGFILQGGHNVYMSCALDKAHPSPVVPEGVTIRSLVDEGEIERYNTLYSFTPMSAYHRLELLHSPDYIHHVVVELNGDFIAFCECSIDREEWSRGGRQTGWIEYVGVRQVLQGRGHGRAIVIAGLRWLRSQGAQTAALITMGTNIAAQRVYQAVGFSVSERDYIYTRHVDSPASR